MRDEIFPAGYWGDHAAYTSHHVYIPDRRRKIAAARTQKWRAIQEFLGTRATMLPADAADYVCGKFAEFVVCVLFF